MTARYASVSYMWKNRQEWGVEHGALVSIGDPNYDAMAEDDAFDPMLWFYFRDEAEFHKAFENDSKHDFILLDTTDAIV
jgi:hypothetical protein